MSGNLRKNIALILQATCFEYLLELPHTEVILTNIQNMLYMEI